MTQMPVAALLALGMAVCTASVAHADTPPFPGVYGCFGTYYSMGDQFGLVDGSTYSTFNGGRGHYRYDPDARILTMLDGPREGLRYRRVDAGWVFSVLRDNGGPTGQSCPYNPAKDPTKLHW